MRLQESPKDFNQKYNECVINLSYKGGEKQLYLLQEVPRDGTTMSGFILKNDTWIPRKFQLKDVEMDDTWPELGMINIGGMVAYAQRTITRQFRKGFTFRNNIVSVQAIEPWIVHNKGLNHGLTDARAVNKIFNPVYYPPEEAIQRIQNQEAVSCAITPRYYMSLSPYLPYIYLGFMGKVIGKVDDEGGCEMFPAAQPLYEDLSNYVNITGEVHDVEETR